MKRVRVLSVNSKIIILLTTNSVISANQCSLFALRLVLLGGSKKNKTRASFTTARYSGAITTGSKLFKKQCQLRRVPHNQLLLTKEVQRYCDQMLQ